METQNYLVRLIEVSNKKYKLLENMLQLYLQQEEELTANETDSQEMHIAKRQEIMDEVDKLDEQFHVYTERLKTTLGIQSLEDLSSFNIPGKAELKEIVSRITALLMTITDRHQKTESHMKSMLQSTGTQIKQVNKTKIMNRAYQPGSTMPTPSVYFDKKK